MLDGAAYARYERQLFVDTLADWGYFGPAPPPWHRDRYWQR
jgi:hypothetical protein